MNRSIFAFIALLTTTVLTVFVPVTIGSSIQIGTSAGGGQVIILGGSSRPTTTDDGSTLPSSIRKYACTSLDGPSCSVTSKSSSSLASGNGNGLTINGADLQKLFAEAIAKAAIDSVSAALASTDKESTSTTTQTLDASGGGGGTTGPTSSIAGPQGTGLTPVTSPSSSSAAATVTTTTTKTTSDVDGATHTSTTTTVTTDTATIQTEIKLNQESVPASGASGAGGKDAAAAATATKKTAPRGVGLTPEQQKALLAQINAQVGNLFAQNGGADGVANGGVQTFAFVLPEAGAGAGANGANGGGAGGAQGGVGAVGGDINALLASAGFEAADGEGGAETVFEGEIEIVDSDMLFGENGEELSMSGEDGEVILSEFDTEIDITDLVDGALAGGVGGAGGVRIASAAGGVAGARRVIKQQQQQQQAAAAATATAGASRSAAPQSTKADAPPNSDSRVRSAKAVELASDRGVTAPSATATTTGTARRPTSPPSPDEVASAAAPSNLNAQQTASLAARSSAGSVTGSSAAAASKAKPASASSATPAAPAEPEPKLADDKSQILQLFEMYQKKTEKKTTADKK